MRRSACGLLLVLAAAGMAAAGAAGGERRPAQVVDRSSEPGTLQAKVDRAVGAAATSGSGRVFWVGYSIERLTGENSHVGTFTDGRGNRDVSIAELLSGKSGPASQEADSGDVQKAARAAIDKIERQGHPEKKVVKELGFFLKFGAGQPPVLSDLEMSDLDLSFDFEGAPLYWLGKAPGTESIGLVSVLYGRARGQEVRRSLIAAAGCHGAADLALPFLGRVLGGDGADDLRKDAAFWIGQQNDPEGLRILVRAARSDTSEEVREGAIFAISQVDLPAAVDELIALARTAEPRDVRKQAVFWIGQMASEKSGPALEEFARKDADIEVQEQALLALSELPDNGGVEPLIKLAKTHPDPRVRKKAVFWLGECDDPRALDALIAIIKGK